MFTEPSGLSRRALLAASGALLLGREAPAQGSGPKKRLKVAVVYTEMRPRSHGHVIVENFVEPPLFNGAWVDPGMDIVSFWGDQEPARDMAAEVAQAYGIKRYPTIAGALCQGGKELAVDAVLSIGEHGNYPINEKGVREYPRKRFFDEIVKVFRASGRVVPVFNDKHLSYRWDWAKEMYDTAQELKIPFMAGSSVPLAERRPMLDLPPNARIADAVAVHGGPFEAYDFHGLELLQSLVEGRDGGEAGVSKIQFVEGDAFWKAGEEGGWSIPLTEAAMAAEFGSATRPLKELAMPPMFNNNNNNRFRRFGPRGPWAILVEYRDGFKAAVVKIGRGDNRWNFACRLEGETQPRAARFFVGPWHNRALFKALSHAIQAHFRTGVAPYPAERTLLVTGMLEAAVDSRQQMGAAIATPHLGFRYAARDFRAFRENGTSWKILQEDSPEPPGIHKRG